MSAEERIPGLSATGQLIGAWSGVVTIVFFGLSFWPFAQFLPPLSPSLTAAEVAFHYRQHANGIRTGMIFMLFAGTTNLLFVAAIAVQLRRIKNVDPIWTYTQITAGVAGSVIIVIGAMLMTAVAFRPDRSPEILYALFDLAWVMVVMPAAPAVLQICAIGFAILSGDARKPFYPRWLGYFNLWIAILFIPGALISYFKSGPFAWDGLVTFWIPAVFFGAWFLLMTIMMLRRVGIETHHKEPSQSENYS